MGAVAAAAMLASVSSVRASSMSILDLEQPNASITSGDKIFYNFTYTVVSGNEPTAGNVLVSTVGTGTGTDYFGIKIAGGFSDVAGDRGSEISLTYSVRVATGAGMVITDAHMNSDVIGSGLGAYGFGTISETYVDPIKHNQVGAGITNFVIDSNPAVQSANDVWGLPGYTSLDVTKDIQLKADTGVVGVSDIYQTFSQATVVPVPDAAWMGGGTLLGMAAVAGLRKRMRLA